MSGLRRMAFEKFPVKEEIYLIKNKDTVLGSFTWLDEDEIKREEDLGLPAFITSDFMDWLDSRTPSRHRTHMQQLVQHLGLGSLKAALDFSKGLALTDTLWIVPKSSTLSWNDVSLFENPFDDVIARIAFDGEMHGIPLSTLTPELSTNGMLAKCWVRGNVVDNISLVKRGTAGASNAGNEPYSENLVHQVLTRLDYTHVPYQTGRYRGQLVSICPLFTSETEMLLPIYRYYNFQSLSELIDLCTKDGIVAGLAQHLVFDYLSWNTDRHAGNLGVILDADSFALKTFAPIFDNGVSMLNYWNGEDDLDDYTTRSTPALYSSFERGAKLGKHILGNKHNVQRLIGFQFDRSQVPGYSNRRVDSIEAWLQERVKKFLAM